MDGSSLRCFLDWGKQFTAHLLKEDPCSDVLLLDGHSPHMLNIEFLILVRQQHACCVLSFTYIAFSSQLTGHSAKA